MQTPRDGDIDGRMPHWTLRNQAAEYNRLQEENFNHKMRIHFLEDQLIRLNNGDTVFGSEEMEAEVGRLRSALEDRDRQLAEQDASMTRAAQALDLLQEQLREAQAATARAEPTTQRERRLAVDNNDAEALRAKLESVVEESSLQVRELQLELRAAKENVETPSKQVEYAQENYTRDVDITEKVKERYQQLCEYHKSYIDKLREEVAHVRRMMKGKDELVETLRDEVDSLWQRKEQEGREHTAALTRISNKTEELRLEEERCHADWYATCAKLEENLLARNKDLVREVRKLKR
ncbi:hypothetical protein PHYPSEUDO_002434 [Phytophthora pseudosyringae]|uniref:Centrosomin N-terminal motif 1 domain-containing protein n=1 Tax=Phytophthora pseudosyringae TaxID=221518 RepID=A0A8T1VXK5_9STRA|nr:hypothetical protein PHYPSEUDO_002434 [Phytophthora pseudosyringae]